MPPLLNRSHGVPLDLDNYIAEFDEHFWKIGGTGFWKLERRQVFQEPDDSSWAEFHRGDWKQSIQLLDDRLTALGDHYRRIHELGFHTWRIRVVEEPLTPYMLWELQLLHRRHQLGGSTHILNADRITDHEPEQPLPEIVTLGDDRLYEIIYDDNGLPARAVRHQNPELVGEWRTFIQHLYWQGEDMGRYFDRQVRNLTPPGQSSGVDAASSWAGPWPPPPLTT